MNSTLNTQPSTAFAEVLLPFGDVVSNHPYTYSIPDRLQGKFAIGDFVWVPFRASTASGVIVGFPDNPGRATKPIQNRNMSLAPISSETLELSKWLSERYACSWWDALRGFVTASNGRLSGDDGFEDSRVRGNDRGEVVGASRTSLLEKFSSFELTPEQGICSSRISDSLTRKDGRGFLLHGITGSGKTEIYLTAAREALNLGREVLVLVPEIPLSFHVSKRFRAVFGERVAVFHSGLTEKEKRVEQGKLQQGQAAIAVGPRAALFAPFKNLGMIVMDEEHDPSYKQESNPRYHAFVLAKALAQQHRAILVLGSATPSLESYLLAEKGEMKHLTLKSRYESRPLPPVEIVDLRLEKSWESRPFSTKLLEALKASIADKQQAILFINRRGFSPIVFCRDCGHTFYCSNCSITLTYHQSRKLLRCHYCDYQNRVPEACPSCHGDRLSHRGFGTERLEERLRELIPEAKTLRLDRDTSSKRGGTKTILETFGRGEANVLVGTQMVTKGFDFPNVNLVGILSADHLLHFPDFRSGERTFQLLTQVAGRAGRGSAPSRVILQAYDPEHPVIQAAAHHDYQSFYRQEIGARKRALYPPFVSLANLLLSGPDEASLEEQGKALRVFVLGKLPEDQKSFLLGPSSCPIQKISKNFRWHLLLKSQNVDELAKIGREIYAWYAENGSRKIRLTIDIDPIRLL